MYLPPLASLSPKPLPACPPAPPQHTHTHTAVRCWVPHLLFDELPDDPGHLISVHLHHRLGDLDAFFVAICEKVQSSQSQNNFHLSPGYVLDTYGRL